MVSARHSVQMRAMIGVTAVVAVSTMVCGYVTHRLAQSSLQQVHVTDMEVLADMTERLAATSMATDGPAGIARALDVMSFDPRICFAVARRRDGVLIARRITDATAWQHYQQYYLPTRPNGMVDVNRSVMLTRPDGSSYTVRRQAILTPAEPATSSSTHQTSASTAPLSASQGGPSPANLIMGYIELGMVDPQASEIKSQLRFATLIVIAGTCLLAFPIVMWLVHGFVRPLRRMVTATNHLREGRTPEPVPVVRQDEIGLLAESFNTMAHSLMDTQHALSDANTELESKVRRRTADLKQANEQLQSEMREKDTFVRVVTHDLNAPLRNIAGITQLLLHKHAEAMETDVIGKLERISANVKAETELIDDLLELSRIKSRPGKRTEVDLNDLVTSVRDSFSYDLQQKDITLTVDDPLPTAFVDRIRMRQVFQNLIDNAAKYMPEDAAVREIHVGCVQGESEQTLYVRDTGAGIDPKDHDEIFQVFRRARHSSTDQVPGRGVGLAGVKAIIESYDGLLRVESEPGHGATFWFTLGEAIKSDGEQVQSQPVEA